MRVFFAIEFNNGIKDYLFSLQQDMRKYCIGGNFSLRENFHLTLRFIGEQNLRQVEILKNVLKEVAAATSQFELRLDNTGSFNKGNKKIIWAGLDRSIELQHLYQRLEISLEKNGFQKEDRAYSPHITLAREVRIVEAAVDIAKTSISSPTIMVNSISLMESARINNKLTYTALYRAELF